MTTLTAHAINLRCIDGKGRGIFAPHDLDGETVLAVFPSVVLSTQDCEALEKSILGEYYFLNPEDENAGLFLLGWVSLLNHAEEANCVIEWDKADIGWLASLKTKAAIAKGEELTISYRCQLWFEPV